MTEREAMEKLKNMRLFMQLEDEKNESKFAEDDYKANEMAIQALERQIAKPPELCGEYRCCPNCGIVRRSFERYCSLCGQKIRLE